MRGLPGISMTLRSLTISREKDINQVSIFGILSSMSWMNDRLHTNKTPASINSKRCSGGKLLHRFCSATYCAQPPCRAGVFG